MKSRISDKLPLKLSSFAADFLLDLRTGRYRGKITPSRPISARRLCKIWKHRHITPRDVAILVSFWVGKGEPLVVSRRGYFYARDPLEFRIEMAKRIFNHENLYSQQTVLPFAGSSGDGKKGERLWDLQARNLQDKGAG